MKRLLVLFMVILVANQSNQKIKHRTAHQNNQRMANKNQIRLKARTTKKTNLRLKKLMIRNRLRVKQKIKTKKYFLNSLKAASQKVKVEKQSDREPNDIFLRIKKRDAKNRQEEGLSDEQKIEKNPDKYYWEYQMSNKEKEKESIMNRKAQELYDENPYGNDQSKDLAYQSDLLVRRYEKGQESQLKVYYVMLNQDNLFISEDENQGYRGIVDSLAIQDLFDKERDNVRMGQCCESVGIIMQRLFGDINSQQMYSCIQVDGRKRQQSWTICGDSYEKMDQFRQALILQIITYGLSTFGIHNMEPLMNFQKVQCDKPTGWNYHSQSRWPCMCGEGIAQSPIDIKSNDTIRSQPTIDSLKLRYSKVTSFVNHMDWQQGYLTGDWGGLLVKNRQEQKTANGKMVRFKFPSEHRVDGVEYPCEMQIYHDDGDGDRIALSVFLTDREDQVSSIKQVAIDNQQSVDNMVSSNIGFKQLINDRPDIWDDINEKGSQFISQFMIDSWLDIQETNRNTDKCIESPIDLNSIIKQSNIMSLSFYKYMGSDTQPPCNEDVTWFILKDRLYIPSLHLRRLEEKVVGRYGSSNNRRLMPNADRKVLSVDLCPKYEFHSRIEEPEDAQYVKAKVKQHYYGIIYPGTKTMFDTYNKEKFSFYPGGDRQNEPFTMERIGEDQMRKISPQIHQDLRYQLGEWLVDNRHAIMNGRYNDQRDKYRFNR